MNNDIYTTQQFILDHSFPKNDNDYRKWISDRKSLYSKYLNFFHDCIHEDEASFNDLIDYINLFYENIEGYDGGFKIKFHLSSNKRFTSTFHELHVFKKSLIKEIERTFKAFPDEKEIILDVVSKFINLIEMYMNWEPEHTLREILWDGKLINYLVIHAIDLPDSFYKPILELQALLVVHSSILDKSDLDGLLLGYYSYFIHQTKHCYQKFVEENVNSIIERIEKGGNRKVE